MFTQMIKRRNKKRTLKNWLKEHLGRWKPKTQKTPASQTKNSA